MPQVEGVSLKWRDCEVWRAVRGQRGTEILYVTQMRGVYLRLDIRAVQVESVLLVMQRNIFLKKC